MPRFTKPLILLLIFYIPSSASYDGGSGYDVIQSLQKAFHETHKLQDIRDEKLTKVEGPQPNVQTTSGLIYGVTTNQDHSFYSVPFAVPPIGELRFQPPQALDQSNEVLNVSIPNKVVCQQFNANCSDETCVNVNEDCLVLNVHVPNSVDLSDAGNPPTIWRPVMFWIHGGAFFLGSGTSRIFDGRFLSNVTNTIVVSTNYRLGPFGFLVQEEGPDAMTGNQGLKDQQRAMQWVQDNIENFGGDKNQVTIFGESAGAQSVMFHLLSDVSEPLFHRAIMESNPAVFPYPTYKEALNVTEQVLRLLRCGPFQSDLNCLLEATPTQLNSAMAFIMAQSASNLDIFNAVEPFRPYIDGSEYTDQPLNLFKDGKWQNYKPVIIGTNSEELDILKFLNPLALEIGRNGFYAINNQLLGEIGEKVSVKYEEMEGPNITDYGLLFGKEMTDLFFGCSSRSLARLSSKTATEDSVYLYVFSHHLDGADCEEHLSFISSEFCGYSYHSSELYFVFRVIEHLGMEPDPEDLVVTDQFSNYWGSFARTGNPSNGLENPLHGEFPDWPPYNGEPWKNMRIDEPQSWVESSFDEEVCDFWDELDAYIAVPDITPTTTSTSVIEITTTSSASSLSPPLCSLIVGLFFNLKIFL